MADITCIDCGKQRIPIPDDSVYYTGPDFPNLGIRQGQSLKTVNTIILNALPSLQSTGDVTVTASTVRANTPSVAITSGYSNCADQVSNRRGNYTLSQDSADSYMFSYDFQDTIQALRDVISVNKVDVTVYITENGVVKKHTNTNKSSNAFSFSKDNFPVQATMKIDVSNDVCSKITLVKDLSVGTLMTKNRLFTFDVIGTDGKKESYTQEDINKMLDSKITTLNNVAADLVAGEYTKTVNELKVNMESVVKAAQTEQQYTVGTGLNMRTLTQTQVISDMYDQLSRITEQIAKLQSA
jgi:hypothetical protein